MPWPFYLDKWDRYINLAKGHKHKGRSTYGIKAQFVITKYYVKWAHG